VRCGPKTCFWRVRTRKRESQPSKCLWYVFCFLSCVIASHLLLTTSAACFVRVQAAVKALVPMERPVYGAFNEGKAFSAVLQFMDHACNLVLRASPFWRNFGQLWTVYKEFAALGYSERQFLLSRHMMSECCALALSKDSPRLGKLRPDMVLRVDIGVKNTPNYADMLEMFAIIVWCVQCFFLLCLCSVRCVLCCVDVRACARSVVQSLGDNNEQR
jgi:hypothetical protein